jgi:amidase
MPALTFTSATELAAAVRGRSVSSVDLTRSYIDAIQKTNPSLNAIVVSNEADAVRTARERDDEFQKGVVRGPLHGVPVTVQEAFNLAGHNTTVNFLQLKNNVATQDAFVVRPRRTWAPSSWNTNIPTMPSDYQSFAPIPSDREQPLDLGLTPGGSTGGGALPWLRD